MLDKWAPAPAVEESFVGPPRKTEPKVDSNECARSTRAQLSS
jgi:hypothetical protein